MTLSFRITSITSNSGDVVSLPSDAVTVVVGANNAGKSQLLRDIAMVLSQETAVPKTLLAIEAHRPRPADDAEAGIWLDEYATVAHSQSGQLHWMPNVGGANPVSASQFRANLEYGAARPFPYLGSAAPFFVHSASAGTLARYASGSAPVGMSYDGQTSPLGQLYRDGALEEELNTLAKASFGQEVLLDRANQEIRLRVGAIDVPVPPLNRPTRQYADAVLQLPTLDDQGDGMKSFIGLALLVMARPPGVLLIDEPEAFLHPGQARALGRWLGGAARDRQLQIVVATHDRDLLLGLLESDAPVNVVRIVRDDDDTQLTQLLPDQVREVWNDPVLRYSNVLQGLFHAQVVVCESDGDCRFFGAALDTYAASEGKRALADEVLFVPGGGKQRVAAIARALGHLKVRSRAIVDFDVLRSRDMLIGIVSGVGGTWLDEMAADYVAAVEPIQTGGIWDQVKSQGLSAVPAGAPNAAAARLLESLRATGVHVVPVGEMEGFDRSQALHGAAWVSNAIENSVHASAPVRDFVAPVIDGHADTATD